MWDYFEHTESATYKKLCMCLGRPTLKQMCLRAANVIVDQCDIDHINFVFNKNRTRATRAMPEFIKKITRFTQKCTEMKFTNKKPKQNDYFKTYYELKTFQARRNFIKAATDNLLLDHLERKGWEATKGNKCRIAACTKNVPEDLQHLILDHLPNANAGNHVQRTMSKLLNQKINRKRKNSNERPNLNLDHACAKVLATMFDEIKEPQLKIRIINKDSNNQKVNKKKTYKKLTKKSKRRPLRKMPKLVSRKNAKFKIFTPLHNHFLPLDDIHTCCQEAVQSSLHRPCITLSVYLLGYPLVY